MGGDVSEKLNRQERKTHREQLDRPKQVSLNLDKLLLYQNVYRSRIYSHLTLKGPVARTAGQRLRYLRGV